MTSGEYNMTQVWLKRIVLSLAVLAGGIGIFYGAICISIFTEVNEICQYAVKKSKGQEILYRTVRF